MAKFSKLRLTRDVLMGAAALTFSAGAFAYAYQAQPKEDHMAAVDTNKDGKVSRAEAQAMAVTIFGNMDVNNDGQINDADRAAHRRAMDDAHFADMDGNKDGVISKAEFDAAHAKPDHKAMGHVETEDVRETTGPNGERRIEVRRIVRADGKGGHGDVRREGRGDRMGGGRIMMMIGPDADANGDKSLSRAEFMAGFDKHFAQVDTDKDGFITAAERQAFHKAQGGKKRGGKKPGGQRHH